METDKIRKVIAGVELFRGLTPAEVEVLAGRMRPRACAAGEVLFRENSPREELFVIAEGRVELTKTDAYGSRVKVAVFAAGDFLGEGSWERDSLHSTTAAVIEPATVLGLGRDFFTHDAALSLKILSNIMRVISRRMRNANAMMISSAAQYESGRTRLEHDLLGERLVPYEAYYGVQTLRGMENFNISGVTLNFFPALIEALAQVKKAAALANRDLGLLESGVAGAIVAACDDLAQGKLHNHFTVDMIQGGAGTSTNMNANEVIANRALELLGREKGDYAVCHPNNHVNLSQSTNDAYPTAVKIALINSNARLVEGLETLIQSFDAKALEFARVIKMGRTQLQDAVPMTLGQEFGAYAATLREEAERLRENARLFLEVNMGATAIGTGINSDPDYPAKVIVHLRAATGLPIVNSANLVEATQDTGAFIMYSAAVKRLAVKLSKICNDLRLLSSGPRTGINEINLPPMQPGSSIMPGKVNPVIPEVVNQIAFKVIGNDLTVTLASEAGQLELNVMEPVIVYSLFESIEMLKNGMATLQRRCIDGITANEERCLALVRGSIGLVTALNPILGYEASTAVAKQALETGASVYDLVLAKGLLSKEALDSALAPENMIAPRKMPARKN
ncbi:MAG: aspartate ammonia-lyase [Elusimicrobiales bacterium]